MDLNRVRVRFSRIPTSSEVGPDVSAYQGQDARPDPPHTRLIRAGTVMFAAALTQAIVLPV